MKVKELIKELERFDGELEVQYDYDMQHSTISIDDVFAGNKNYNKEEKQIVVIF